MPVARGSRVPVWPTLANLVALRAFETTLALVQVRGLSMTRKPFRSGFLFFLLLPNVFSFTKINWSI